jgi:hypothetical protein
MMQDWAGWLLMLFSFSIVLMWKSVRSDTKVVRAIWFCMVLHHAVAYFNVYLPDASAFHGEGVAFAGLSEPEWEFYTGTGTISGSAVYIQFLGSFYRVIGSSHFFGRELSVLAFVLSCVVLVKLADFLDMRRFRVGIVLLFGLLPSAMVFMSSTLREPWQALFFLLSVYLAMRIWKNPGILNVSFLLISVSCLALTHHGLAKFAMYLIAISVYWGISGRKKSVRWARHLRFLFAGLVVACVIILAQKMELYMTLGEAVDAGAHLRLALSAYTDVRTNFNFILDASSMLGIVTTIPMVFVEYMFAPFPWQVGYAKDVLALLESMLRFVLLFFAVSSWFRSSGEVRSCYGFLLIAILGLELVWALGTANWGTAIRHHVPGYGVIVLLGAPRLILFVRELHFGIFSRGKVSGEFNEQVLHRS